MKLRAKWTGQPPCIGEYLMSQHRPRFAYRIAAITTGDSESKLEFEVDKVKLHSVPDDAVVHPWKWDPRTKTTTAWSGL